MPDPSVKLADRIKGRVYAVQAEKLHRLAGKYVERYGITYLVKSVDWRRGKIVVSDTETPLKQTTTFNIKSFLSKAVTVLREAEDEGADDDREHRGKDGRGGEAAT